MAAPEDQDQDQDQDQEGDPKGGCEKRRKSGWGAKILLVLLSCFAVLVAAEIGLRLFGIGYPSFQQLDPDCGTSLRPGARGWYREEGNALVEINRAGQRDKEHAKEKPPGTIRVAVLGDSYAEARQVPLEKTFFAVLERELAKCSKLHDKKIEVINFGVSGYGTAQELISLRRRVWDTSPDIVVLAFTTGNDVRNNSRALDGEPMRPYFTLDGDRLLLDDSFLQSAGYKARSSTLARSLYGAIDHIRLLQVANRAKNSLRARREASRQQTVGSPEGGNAEGELGLDDAVYLDPPDENWKEAWRVTEALIGEMNKEVQSKGARFLAVTLSNGVQVNPDPSVRADFMRRKGITDLFKPDEGIKALGEREGFAVLNLAREFQAYAEKNHVYLHGFANTSLGSGHWNEAGHALAGEQISKKLCEMVGK